MAAKRNPPVHALVVGVSTKANFRRPVPKTYSYRYEVATNAGPADDPLVRAGAAIIERRYRGRAASWNIGRSMMDSETYAAKGAYVHPLEDNPMAYPPRSVQADALRTPTPGFAPTSRFDSNVPPEIAALPTAAKLLASAPQIGATSRRALRRPTPANEPAYRKTG